MTGGPTHPPAAGRSRSYCCRVWACPRQERPGSGAMAPERTEPREQACHGHPVTIPHASSHRPQTRPVAVREGGGDLSDADFIQHVIADAGAPPPA